MTDTQRTDRLLRAARLTLTNEEKDRFCHTMDDFLRLARNLDEIPSEISLDHTLEYNGMREDKACISNTQPCDILNLSEGVTDRYIAVPITVDQQ